MSKKTQHLSMCDAFIADGKHEKFRVSQIWKEEMSIPSDDITYVTQVTLDRFHMIETILNQWSGPLSISIYLDINETLSLRRTLYSYPSIFERDNVDFHIVLATGVGVFQFLKFSQYSLF